MKINYSIALFLMLTAAGLLLSPGTSYPQGQVQYTKEMLVGKWLNTEFGNIEFGYHDYSTTDTVGQTERLTFNADGSFEHFYYIRGNDFVKTNKVTAKYTVKDNVILLSGIVEEEPIGDMFPPKWNIVASEINLKLGVLELEPDDCTCYRKRNVKLCRLVK